MGGYNQGQDKDLDEAIMMWPRIIDFITQPNNEKASFESSISELLKLFK
jgi:flagellum-specific ATP synthase